MPREIKTTLAVDGEAAFKRAINDANTSMKNLGTQLTLAAANFKKDGDAMKLMETRSKALNAEITQQNEIVKALQKAVEDSTKAYGENSAKTEKWQAELNRAQAKLVSLQNELTLNEAGLDRNGKAFDESSQKAADYQATLEGIGKNVSFETVTSGVSKITGAMEAAFRKAVSLGNKIRETMVDAGRWADELITNATKYGMDVETLQKWQNAADLIDTPVESIISARDKLSKKMAGGWKDGQIDMWEMLGINLYDDNGSFRDQMDVLFEVGETLKNVAWVDGNDIRADTWAMELFGKSYKELLPLFTTGQAEWEKMVASQRVVSEEHVKALGEMDDANQELENSWETLKYSALASIAPAFTEISEGLSSLLNEINDWLATEEGQEAMQGLSDALKELFKGITDIQFSDAINVAKEGIHALTDGLGWLNQNKGSVLDALKVIAGGFALLKVSEGVLTFLKLKAGWNLATGKGLSGTETATSGVPSGSSRSGGYNYISEAEPGGGAIDTGVPVYTQGGLSGILNKFTLVSAAAEAAKAFDIRNYAGFQTLQKVKASTEGMSEQDAQDEYLKAAFGMSDQQLKEYRIGEAQAKGEAPDQKYVKAPLEDLASEMTDAQVSALEMWWDAVRGGEDTEKAWENIDEAFSGSEDVLDEFFDVFENWKDSYEDDNYQDMENLLTSDSEKANELEHLSESSSLLDDAAASLRVNTEAARSIADRMTGIDLKNFNSVPAQMVTAVANGAASGVSGIRVYMDGYAVGSLIAPYVSQLIGAAAM